MTKKGGIKKQRKGTSRIEAQTGGNAQQNIKSYNSHMLKSACRNGNRSSI